MNLCVYTCFAYLQPFCVTLDFKLFIDSIHILFLLYLLLWLWDFTIKNLQDFIKIYRALIKDIFLGVETEVHEDAREQEPMREDGDRHEGDRHESVDGDDAKHEEGSVAEREEWKQAVDFARELAD